MDHPYFDSAVVAFILITPFLCFWLLITAIGEIDAVLERRHQRHLDEQAKAQHKLQLRHETQRLRAIPKQRNNTQEGDAS